MLGDTQAWGPSITVNTLVFFWVFIATRGLSLVVEHGLSCPAACEI